MTNKLAAATRLALALAGAALLSACAGLGKAPEDIVRERAQERMDLLLAEDYAAAYDYLSPGYRSGVSETAYQRRMFQRRAQWTAATVGKSECSEDVCKVRISIDYTVYGVVPGMDRFDSTTAAVENWVEVDGTWYHVPEE